MGVAVGVSQGVGERASFEACGVSTNDGKSLLRLKAKVWHAPCGPRLGSLTMPTVWHWKGGQGVG